MEAFPITWDGLFLMGQGDGAEMTVQGLTGADPGRARRQVGMVDAQGGAAAQAGCQPPDLVL